MRAAYPQGELPSTLAHGHAADDGATPLEVHLMRRRVAGREAPKASRASLTTGMDRCTLEEFGEQHERHVPLRFMDAWADDPFVFQPTTAPVHRLGVWRGTKSMALACTDVDMPSAL